MRYFILLLGLFLFACNSQKSNQEDISNCITMSTLSDMDISFQYDKIATPLVIDLIDVYNGFNILNSIYTDTELWIRFDMDVHDAIKKMDCSIIKDDSIKAYACNYKNQILSILSDTSIQDSVKLEKIGMAYSFVYGKLVDRYHVSHYGELSEEKYQEKYDKKEVVQDYDSIFSLRGTSDTTYLKQLANEAKSFDAKCIYTLEYAHTVTDDLEHPAIKGLEYLMKSEKYSIYLYEIWRTWRCLLQEDCFGSSKDSEIPNDLYNRMRLVCAHTILEYIIQHSSDIMAINQFIVLSSINNIERYGVYPYGNQNMMEQLELFYERYKDVLEEGQEDVS